MSTRSKAWAFLLDKMEAAFNSGDIGRECETPADDDYNSEICEEGIKLVRLLRKRGVPKASDATTEE